MLFKNTVQLSLHKSIRGYLVNSDYATDHQRSPSRIRRRHIKEIKILAISRLLLHQYLKQKIVERLHYLKFSFIFTVTKPYYFLATIHGKLNRNKCTNLMTAENFSRISCNKLCVKKKIEHIQVFFYWIQSQK